MTDWVAENKGSGPWVFERQGNKHGYSNNPRFTDKPANNNRHAPCGYWLNGDKYEMVTQTIDGTQWILKAPKLNTEQRAYCLTVLNGKIYAGTAKLGNGSIVGGVLHEWNGVDAWVQVAPQLNGQTEIYDMMVYNGEIYAVTGEGGGLFKWNGANAWVQLATKYSNDANVLSIALYNDKIYGATAYGNLLEWNGSDAWVRKAPFPTGGNEKMRHLLVLGSNLYSVAGGSGKLWVWNDVDAWVEKAPKLNLQLLPSGVIYNDKIYAGTAGGRLFKWNGADAWIQVAPQLSEDSIESLCVFGNRLYGGTYSLGKLYRWNDVDAWEEMAPRLLVQVVIYDLTVLDNQLYGGTGNWGNLFMWNSYTVVRSTLVSNILEVDNAVWTMPA